MQFEITRIFLSKPNQDNIIEELSDEDIEKAIRENNITYMIMQAMGQSQREEYMKYILPFLDGDFYELRAAIQAILNVNGQLGLEAMKKKSEQYSLEDEDPWYKILLMVAIMAVEEGTEGLKQYFMSEEGDSRVKDTILTFYDMGYQYKKSDKDIGLEYAWDGVLQAVRELGIRKDADVCVLGKKLAYEKVTIDPGLMGLGIVEHTEVSKIKDKLLKSQEKLESVELWRLLT